MFRSGFGAMASWGGLKRFLAICLATNSLTLSIMPFGPSISSRQFVPTIFPSSLMASNAAITQTRHVHLGSEPSALPIQSGGSTGIRARVFINLFSFIIFATVT